MDRLADWLSDNLHQHSLSFLHLSSFARPYPSLSTLPATGCRLKLLSSGSHQFSPASPFYRLFFIHEKEGGGVSEWFRVTLHGGWRRIKATCCLEGEVNEAACCISSGNSMQFLGHELCISLLLSSSVCACDICCVAVLLRFLSHFLSVLFFPTVMSVTCGGLLWNCWTSVNAKHRKSVFGGIVAQYSLHKMFFTASTSCSELTSQFLSCLFAQGLSTETLLTSYCAVKTQLWQSAESVCIYV